MRKLLIASVSLLVWTRVASAQDGLVSVNIQDVLKDISVELNVDETSIPVNVQLPVNVAANVCDVDVSVLSAKVESGDATCAAVTGSQELTQVVQQQVASGGTNEDNDQTAGASDDDDDNVANDGSSSDDTKTSSVNSAKKFAPGQSDNKAPGLTDDPKANAPGQMKKACPEGQTCE